MFIRDSRRSYRTYSYPELILIIDLCSFGTLVGVTELILITDLCSFETPVGVTELILVFRILFLSYRAYTYLTDLILALRNMYLSYRSYTCFTYTGVPVGTTGLILSLTIREYP